MVDAALMLAELREEGSIKQVGQGGGRGRPRGGKGGCVDMSEGRGEGTGGEGGEGGLRVRPYVSVFGCNWRGGRGGGVQRAADARRLAWVFGSMCVEEGEFEGGRKSGGGEGQMSDGSRSEGRGREGGSLGVCVWEKF